MTAWNIVADSSIDLFEIENQAGNITFDTVPFTISVGQNDFVDDANLNKEQLLQEMKNSKTASRTACPGVGAWVEKFKQEGHVIALTITSNLSGSYNSACVARDMVLAEHPEKSIYVIDSLSVGPEMILLLRKLCSLIEAGKDFATVVQETLSYAKRTHVTFALNSFDNLVKNGRMPKLAGFVANKFSLSGIGIASEQGTIEMKGITRGQNKTIKLILSDLQERGKHIEQVVISHSQNLELAEKLKASIQGLWEKTPVTILPTRGLCSYYAEQGGLIIGFEGSK